MWVARCRPLVEHCGWSEHEKALANDETFLNNHEYGYPNARSLL
jgi:hypothetical protein